MNVLDLFSGIGGFSLGLERAGMRTVAFCEIDPYCRRVLAQHWPTVPVFGDVRTLTADTLADAYRNGRMGNKSGPQRNCGDAQSIPKHSSAPTIDLICGGFPCQDISTAGKGAGIGGARSGLWGEYARIIGEVRPRYVIVENVAALLGRGLERVLGDLAALGYDAEWHCIPASAVGAPHRRDRVWIIANASCVGGSSSKQSRTNVEHDICKPAQLRDGKGQAEPDVAHPDQPRLEGRLRAGLRECAGECAVGEGGALADPTCELLDRARETGPGWRRQSSNSSWWSVEPDVGRVAHGVSARVDRLRSLGNAVVPQIPEIIGRAIMMSARP